VGGGFLGGEVNGGSDAGIGAAAAEVTSHGGIDLGVRRIRRLSQKRSGAHHLARLAVTALGHIDFIPRLLDGGGTLRVEPLDGGDRPSAESGYRELAGTHGFAIQMNGAGPA